MRKLALGAVLFGLVTANANAQRADFAQPSRAGTYSKTLTFTLSTTTP